MNFATMLPAESKLPDVFTGADIIAQLAPSNQEVPASESLGDCDDCVEED